MIMNTINLKELEIRKENSYSLTATTDDLGNWLKGKMVLYLANPNNGLNLVPNPLSSGTLYLILKNVTK